MWLPYWSRFRPMCVFSISENCWPVSGLLSLFIAAFWLLCVCFSISERNALERILRVLYQSVFLLLILFITLTQSFRSKLIKRKAADASLQWETTKRNKNITHTKKIAFARNYKLYRMTQIYKEKYFIVRSFAYTFLTTPNFRQKS